MFETGSTTQNPIWDDFICLQNMANELLDSFPGTHVAWDHQNKEYVLVVPGSPLFADNVILF